MFQIEPTVFFCHCLDLKYFCFLISTGNSFSFFLFPFPPSSSSILFLLVFRGVLHEAPSPKNSPTQKKMEDTYPVHRVNPLELKSTISGKSSRLGTAGTGRSRGKTPVVRYITEEPDDGHNFQHVINLFTDRHSFDLYSRHASEVLRLCRKNTKGVVRFLFRNNCIRDCKTSSMHVI
jgi:hypothetical protein